MIGCLCGGVIEIVVLLAGAATAMFGLYKPKKGGGCGCNAGHIPSTNKGK